ncbi:MAG: transglutaminase family protein [bacterium]|nr:transglutaminase family protein [bacterium]
MAQPYWAQNSPAPAGLDFLASDDWTDWSHPLVAQLAAQLPGNTPTELARAAFERVKDQYPHALDCNAAALARKASEVLQLGQGYCYTKSLLLAALLRARAIPAGLVYQRLGDPASGYALHGLVALWLDRWHLLDARGDNAQVKTTFDLETPSLAYPGTGPGEGWVPQIFTQPPPEVAQALAQAADCQALTQNYPDRLL